MPKILHTASYKGTPWEILKSVVPNDFHIETLEEATYENLLRQCVDADYLLVSGRLPIDEGVLSVAKNLKMIQRTGVGTEMLDKEAIKRHGIPVYVNFGVNARSVAEHTLTLMLCCLKNIPLISNNVKKGIWAKQQTGLTCNEIFGKTVGIVGMGAIGKQVATYLNVLGANVLYTDIYRLDISQEKNLSLTFIPTLEEMLPQIDILSLHCPLTSTNRGMINKDTLSLMKRNAIIVNTARGKLIDEEALYNTLLSGYLKCVALDVHSEEPIKMPTKFANLDNVIMTPHIAGLSYEAFQSMVTSAINNILSYNIGNFDTIKSKKII